MLYSRLAGPRHWEIMDGAVPRPGSGQVLVEIKACGVCASELETWARGKGGYLDSLGHEPAGVVREVGAGVRGLRVGDPVTGLFTQAYSQFQVADQDLVMRVPDGVSLESALGEPLACMVNAQRRTTVELADRVAVIGLGFMGLGMLQLLRLRGPSHVVAVDVRKESLEKALELGADEAYHPENLPEDYLLDEWEEWDGPKGFDVVIEGSGTQAGLTLAGRMVRAHGVLSIVGFHQGGLRQVDMEMWNWKAMNVVNAHVRRREELMESMRIGLELMAEGLMDMQTLITHRYGLDEVERAYANLEKKPEGFVKAVILPR